MSDSPVQQSAKVYLASFAALLGALSMGLALGYTGPALVDMEKDKNSTILSPDVDKRDGQKNMIGSMLAVGAFFGGLLGEPANKMLGRRWSLIMYGLPFVIGWLLITVANSLTMIILGRLLTGLCCGLVSGTAPTYVVEIATPQIRGLLGTCFQVMVVIGILLDALFSLFLGWQALAGVSIIAAVGMSVLMFGMPETPQWLLSKNRNDEAEASLKQFRVGSINQEFDTMRQSATNAQQSGSQYSLSMLTDREFYKPFILAIGLMFFQQFSGINAILFYQGTIFQKAAPQLDATKATIYVCLAQVIATIIGSFLVDRLGRKALLLISGVGHTISLLVFGMYINKTFPEEHAWIALLSLVVFISSFSVGYGPIPWMMIPELSSARVRSIVASLATAFNWICVYIVTAVPSYNWIYWVYATFCALSCIFVFFSLPETKGRTPEQIQRQLLGEEGQHLTVKAPEQGSMKALA